MPLNIKCMLQENQQENIKIKKNALIFAKFPKFVTPLDYYCIPWPSHLLTDLWLLCLEQTDTCCLCCDQNEFLSLAKVIGFTSV